MGGKGKKNKGGRGKAHGGQQKGGRKGQTNGEQSEPAIVVKGKPGRLLPVPGLSNLGNTCFFNSVMQNLGQSHYFRGRLERLLTSPSYDTEIHIPGKESSERTLSVVDSVGPLTSKLFSFLTQMQTSGGGCLNPRPVFSEICKKAPRFSGYHQQDSQELLRYLLDSLHSEEINRIKRAILQSYSVTSSKKEQQLMLTESDRADIKAYGLQAFHAKTFVYDVFGGLLTSTVICKECGNLSTMHETFLDLSLPVAEDKSIANPTSPGGYQTRNKSKKKGDPVETLLPGQQTGQSRLSKHQLKKREQQAKKAARRSKKRELQSSFHQNKDSGDKIQEDGSRENNTDVTDGENSHLDDASLNDGGIEDSKETIMLNSDNLTSKATETVVVDLSNDRTRHDLELVVDSTAGEPQPSSRTSVESGDDQPVTSMEFHTNRYAANGPLPDTSASLDGLEDGVARLEVENQADVMATNESVVFDESCGIEMTEAKPEEDDVLGSSSQTGADHSFTKDLKSLEVELDSLQFSLKKFCTAELLTGSNKFACVVCTKLKAEEKQKHSNQEEDEGPNSPALGQDGDLGQDEGPSLPKKNDFDTLQHGQEDEEANSPERGGVGEDPDFPEISDTMDHHRRITDETEDDSQCDSQGEDKVETAVTQQENHDSSDSTENNQHGDREVVELKDGGSHTDEDSDNEDPKPKEKESDIVFCEATKQLLIEKPPPLFTLHLKRFIQNGRRLRKNNRHVSFPTVLDIGPFCVDSCESERDSKGQMLYSLYGIVEHSGSMHGGHYIAYVRVRSPPNTTPIIGFKQSNKTNKKPHPSVDTNNQTTVVTSGNVDPEKEATSGNVDPEKEVTSGNVDPEKETTSGNVDPEKEVTADNGVSDQTQASPSSDDSTEGSSTMMSNNNPCAVSASVGACKTSEVTDSTLNFDLSSSKGQWYYISDSHVRTATENEVVKSQAYLLFYERLPLV